jgi:hypothetical protein
VSEFKVSTDSTSGALIIERDLASHEKRTVKIVLTFRPIGLIGKIVSWIGLSYPGPILIEVQIESREMKQLFDRRIVGRGRVTEEVITILDPGKGKVKIMMNPEDFKTRWKVHFLMEPLYN